MIPHYLWRVVSSKSRLYDPPPPSHYWSQEDFDDEQLPSWVSSHMLKEEYYAPGRIVSFTGSLLWALNYARYQLRKQKATCVELYLVDTLKLPREMWIFPATILARILDIKPKGIP